MPMDRTRYPANWEAISHHIRFVRAGGRCERCGVRHGAIGYREKDGTFVQLATSKADCGMDVEVASLDGEKIIEIVLTTAHLGLDYEDGTPGNKHDKMDVRDENLAALCQRCHLLEDMDDHVRNRAEGRRLRAIASGQNSFLDAMKES